MAFPPLDVSLPSSEGPVAQWLEPAAHNGLVAGSSPAGPTTHSRATGAIVPWRDGRQDHEHTKVLLPNLPQPWDRLPQGISEQVEFIVFDASEGDQVGVHPGFLEFHYSCFRRLETYDGVFTGMNGPYRNPPS